MKPTDPAFPVREGDFGDHGVDVRLWIATHAIIGVILAYSKLNPTDPYPFCNTTTELARQAWEIADALLDTENPKP